MDQAEKLRNVIKLKNQSVKSNARVITVTSGKGGVGKSNIAVNLAVQMQKMGKRVVIFDADFGLANVEVMFGSLPKYHLGDLIYRGKTIQELITDGPQGVGFVSGGTGVLGMHDLSKEQIYHLVRSLKELDEVADVIIVDTGAGISERVMEFVVASPEVVLVTTPEPSSLTDSYSLLKTLYRSPNFKKEDMTIHMIANRVSSMEEGQGIYNKLNSVVSQFLQGEIFYLGMIPQDQAVEKSVKQQKVVSLHAPNAKSSKAFALMASNLLNHECQKPTVQMGLSRLFARFWNQK